MNTLRKLVDSWNGIVAGIDAKPNELSPRREGRAFGLQWCAAELSAELPKWERLEKAAQEAERVMTHMEQVLNLRVDPPTLEELRAALKEIEQ